MYDTKTNISNTVLLDLTSFELYSSQLSPANTLGTVGHALDVMTARV
jgi:hypothetical protein